MSALTRQIALSIRLPLLIGMAVLTTVGILLFLCCSPALPNGFSAHTSDRNTTVNSPAASASPSDSASPSSAPNSHQAVEDASDIWYWNAEIIRRYQKASCRWTYYQAPLVYSRLEVKWDSRSREAAYFLDGNRISAHDAHKYAQPGSGFPLGSKTPVGDPKFTLSVSHDPPPEPSSDRNRKKSAQAKPDFTRLRNRYRGKYHPDFWQFTALGVSRDFVWVAIRSIPRPPESMPRFRQPDGYQSERHFRESPRRPIQGGILRIDKITGEWVRFTDRNGLPDALICTPVKAESAHLPHFLPSAEFPQEVVAIVPDEKTGRVAFITRSNQRAWYNERQKHWERGEEGGKEP